MAGTAGESNGTRGPRVVFLSGSPTEIGLNHGRQLSVEIRFLVGQMRQRIFRKLEGARGYALEIVAHAMALAMHRRIPIRLREEMRGVASGSGVPYRDILLLNALDDLLNILRRLSPQVSTLGCSSFALFGNRSQDGQLMHGRNLDYHFRGSPLDDRGEVARLLLSQAVLFVYRPMGRAAFLSVGWPGVTGVLTAINQEGISLGNLTSYVRGTTPNGVPTALLYRMLMEDASGLREASGILRDNPRTIGNNLLVGSGGENSAILFEITRDSVEEVAAADGMVLSTNHFVTPALAERQRPFLLPHSVVRRERLGELCDRRGVTPEEALAFLADQGHGEQAGFQNPFARVANTGTAISVLFRPTSMKLLMGMSGEPPASLGPFLPVDVAALLAHDPD